MKNKRERGPYKGGSALHEIKMNGQPLTQVLLSTKVKLNHLESLSSFHINTQPVAGGASLRCVVFCLYQAKAQLDSRS